MSRCMRIALVTLAVVAASVPAAGQEPRAKLAAGGGLLVDGKPFLPIFVWAQPMKNIELLKGLGVNTLHNGEKKDPAKELLDKLHAAGMMGLINNDLLTDDTAGHPAVLAWTVMHECDTPQDPAYAPDLSGDAVALWIEGENPKESSLKPAGWLNVEKPQLSGGKWLVSSAAGDGKAVYEFTVKKPGTYNLWVREFYKTRANPTKWTLDDQAAQETPRSLGTKESKVVARSMAVGWGKYGTVELSEGKHTLTLEVVPGRTNGGASKPVDEKTVLWAVDALCLSTAAGFPPMKKAAWIPRRSPEHVKDVYEKVKQADPNALTWTLFSGAISGGKRIPEETYKEFMKWSDILAFDFYPVTGCNKPERLPQVADCTGELVEWSRPGQPVWVCAESSDQNLKWTAPETPGPSAAEMRCEIWSSIATGAKGIGYFTIAFDPFRWVELTDEVRAEMKRTNAELTELAGPIVLGDTKKKLSVAGDEVQDRWAKGRAIRAIRKEYQGKTYVIAANVSRKAVTPTFKLEGVAADKAVVWKEDRTVVLSDGAFSDAFEPLAVHVYVIAP